MAVKVIVPSKTYNAKYLGVEFKDGVGIFEDEKLAKEIAEALGYEIEEIEPKDEPKDEPKKAPARKKSTKKVEE
jgi:hypothetical protein